jgi:uncharacterized protein (DUF2235 family)
MKRIIVCMDGTWQTLSQNELTNIAVIARSIAHKETRNDGSYVDQLVIYDEGVGSTIGALARRDLAGRIFAGMTRFFGGAFGEGLDDLVLDTYLRIAFNYEKGDEIFIFGFSRGAFAARRLAGFIETAGVVSRLHTDRAADGYNLYFDKPGDRAPDDVKQKFEADARNFRMTYGKGERNADGTRKQTDDAPPIKYLGIFETVAQRGLAEVVASFTPWDDSRRFRFANYRVSSNVENARHATAVDENRIGFPALLWECLDEDNKRLGRQAYQQRWFIGTHSDVGGGDGSKLAAAALKWITDGARDAGLRFYASYGDDHSPLDDALRGVADCYQAPITRVRGWDAIMPPNYPWRPRKVWIRKEKPTAEDLFEYLDQTIVERARLDTLRPHYRPSALKAFRTLIKEWRDPAQH